ncbi:SH3 domain-containing protein [Flavivirga eckloniae]|uniref:SH3b domain-containing protein n=1 Tax=Flavivirga eckloniae TaxID=1803846 RepID=A0A2K9PRG5_9FLAO|nr:SH3 domain-containing protein [Flavivirga eckloniae]AUP79636.1 hypothetical protein C1H87_13330 [Flavivirga eckloniae]
MKTYINIIALLIAFNFAQAQELHYVKADNGLILREKPDRTSNRVTKLDYGTQLEVMEYTNLKLEVIDNNDVISGEWVKIITKEDDYSTEIGYVFNGYLTEEKLKKRFKVGFDELFSLSVDGLYAFVLKENKDTIDVALELGESIEEKNIRIKHHTDYKDIKVFQRYVNSVSIMNEGPHCDLLDWKSYYSSWVPLKPLKALNQFKTNSYTDDAWGKFKDVDINAFKQAVKTHCGDDWAELVKHVKSINEYPAVVSMSHISLKVVFTTMNDEKIEKIIVFEIPMGC